MLKNGVVAAAMAVLALGGCGAQEVVMAGPATYQVTAREGGLTGARTGAQREAIAKGEEYCAAKGEYFNFIDELKGGVRGFTLLTSTITFTCSPDAATAIKGPGQVPRAQPLPVSDTASPGAVTFMLPSDTTLATAGQMGENFCQTRDQTHARLISSQLVATGTRFTFDCVP